jgi:malonyl CoA-acyl carrier protein transacylase
MTDRVILQLLVDALQAVIAGNEDALYQAQHKVNQAQAALLEDEAGVSE